MAEGWLLIIDGGIKYFVESGHLPGDMPLFYEDLVKSYENKGLKILYGTDSIHSDKLTLASTRAMALVDRLNHGEIQPQDIVKQIGKFSKKVDTSP